MNELLQRLDQLLTESADLTEKLNLGQKQQQAAELQDQMQSASFWDNPETAQKVSQTYSNLAAFIEFWNKLPARIEELSSLIKSNTDHSPETETYLSTQVDQIEEDYHSNRLLVMMNGQYDSFNAIFALHAGAGGTDAQDWTEMLLRQYLRYAEKHNLSTEIVDQSKGSEAGIKSVTVLVKGLNAYGLFKSEAGVHRLVRQSPFNPAHTRETSFALLELIPELEEQNAVKLDPNDLEIEANTSSGHGGQSVNTTYSAIRITHKPTGIRVSIQNERSQHQNKELAMKILLGKLQALEDEKLAAEKKELRGEFKSAEWGNQIRSYVLHPYKLVKDHRTDYEESDPDKVLDGNIDNFVESYLETQIK